MHALRFFWIVLLFFIGICNTTFAKEKFPTKKEIVEHSEKARQYFLVGNISEALVAYKLALLESIKLNDNDLIARNYRSVGKIFNELSEFDKSIYYFNRALIFANKSKNDTLKVYIYNNIGNEYVFGKKEFKKGSNYYQKALDITKILKDTSQIVLVNLNLAWAKFRIKKFNEGAANLEFVNKYNNKFGDNYDNIIIAMLNGMYNDYLGKNELANKYFLEGVNSQNEQNFSDGRIYLYKEYSYFLVKINDFKNAYKYEILSNSLNEQFYNEKKVLNAARKGINVEIDEYKREISKIEADNRIQTNNFFKSKVVAIMSLISLLVVGLLLFSISKSSKLNKINNQKLLKKNFQLKNAVEKAQEASKVKSQFVSTISHELRTPLYGVIGITDIIYDEHKDLIDNKHLDALKFSSRYLLALINDILQISKIEESTIVLDNIVFDIYKTVNDIKNALEFIATKNNVDFKIEIDNKIPILVAGDETRLTQILMNLITNALKFTKNGSVTVKLILNEKSESRYFINFEIIDTGIGIAAEDQTKIFEKFTQIKTKDEDYQGTGLGLSIVKKLLKLFNSEIAISSELNVGSTFSFIIAFETRLNNSQKKVTITNLDVDLKILVVEDNKINQLVTKKILQNNNQTCDIVSSGQEAIEILKIKKYDIILMDINMPELNGFETTVEIRKMSIYVPIIALTAYNRKQVMQQADLAGIDAVLVKPFEPEKLFETIEQLLKQKNAD